MNEQTAQRLAQLNNAFYRGNAASFASTRRSAWPGWVRFADDVAMRWGERDPRLMGEKPLRVLDVACGTFRFERFLRERFPQADLRVVALDSCPDLVSREGLEGVSIDYREVDIVSSLLASEGDSFPLPGVSATSFDIVACFGFFHHVPGAANRQRILDALLGAMDPQGALAVSLWRFMDDAGLAEKARLVHAQAMRDLGPQIDFVELERGDWIIGWQGCEGALRYCHSFDDADVEALVQGIRSRGDLKLSTFAADGRTGALNEYVTVYSTAPFPPTMQS